jgi:hypothetical protein
MAVLQRSWVNIGIVLAAGTLTMTTVAAPHRDGRQGAPTVAAADRKACEEASAWAKAHHGNGRLFGGTWRDSSRTLAWREFASQGDLDKVAGGTVFNVAGVWTAPAGILFVQTEAWSSSGDWRMYVDYWFRASGSVARTASELRFLPSNVIARQTVEYDGNGHQTNRADHYYDIHTERELKELDEEARDWRTKIMVVYKRAADLPFYKILTSTKARR